MRLGRLYRGNIDVTVRLHLEHFGEYVLIVYIYMKTVELLFKGGSGGNFLRDHITLSYRFLNWDFGVLYLGWMICKSTLSCSHTRSYS